MSSAEQLEKQVINRVITLNESICSLIELLGGKGIPIVLANASEEQKTEEASSVQNVGVVEENAVPKTSAENSCDEISDSNNQQADAKMVAVEESQAENKVSSDEADGNQFGQNSLLNGESEELDTKLEDTTDEDKPFKDEKLNLTPESIVDQTNDSKNQSETSPQEDDQITLLEIIPSQETLTRKLEKIDENYDGNMDFEKVAKETFNSLTSTKIKEETFIEAIKHYAEHWQMDTSDGKISKDDFLAFWQKFTDLFDEIDQNKDQTIVVIEVTNFLKEQARKHNLKKAEDNIMIYVNQIFKNLDTETDTALNVLEFMMGYPIFLKVLDDYKQRQ
ncbi:unnamed protein product [Oikopleura dioica]|uniref:EF-hand domain-containing protein n=1 Tax=Oikopleura dioica TaxID=34765 RepID=E4YUV7_OIKDI|nr:unnamed protein product [Oikopleura dioica]